MLFCHSRCRVTQQVLDYGYTKMSASQNSEEDKLYQLSHGPQSQASQYPQEGPWPSLLSPGVAVPVLLAEETAQTSAIPGLRGEGPHLTTTTSIQRARHGMDSERVLTIAKQAWLGGIPGVWREIMHKLPGEILLLVLQHSLQLWKHHLTFWTCLPTVKITRRPKVTSSKMFQIQKESWACWCAPVVPA